MSGFWSLEKVNNHDDLWVGAGSDGWSPLEITRNSAEGKLQKLNGVTNVLILMLPGIEIEEITDDNLDEVFTRLRMVEIAAGAMLIDEVGEPEMLSLRHVRRHIGLRVVADIKPSPFAKVLVGALRTQAAAALKSEKENN